MSVPFYRVVNISVNIEQEIPDTVEIFPWSRNFETGILKIDEQHRKLVALINQLASRLAYDYETPELIIPVYDELLDYAAFHFSSEEEIWNRYFLGEDRLNGHKETHHQFVLSVNLLKEDKSKLSQQRAEETLSFLTNWLSFHILESDMRMSKTVLGMQSGMSMKGAEEQANKEMSGVMKVMVDTVLFMYDKLSRTTLQKMREIAERKRVECERNKLIEDLQESVANVKLLSGLLPICASCKKIRDDDGYWNQIEIYIKERSEAEFSHGICPGCAKDLYPDLFKEE